MRAFWVFVATGLVLASGCAQKDWIDRTLVTVDVTGTWEGTTRPISGSAGGSAGAVMFVLQQQGEKVTGEMKFRGVAEGVSALVGGVPIEGTVSGDTFTFHEMTGPDAHGEFQVSGDEMIGSMTRLTTLAATLRRQQ